MKVRIQLRPGGAVRYESLFDLVRADSYSMRWDYDDLDEFTAALTEVALDYVCMGTPVEWMSESAQAKTVKLATSCAAWTWEKFTERPSYRSPATD